MCGITGFISKSNKEIQFDDLLNANQHITTGDLTAKDTFISQIMETVRQHFKNH